ncbi:MAG: PfkB family carbohydrate kinase, partial [Anaerolineales bacterium]|nr:PfkB family carbohydrate kinase [Anaerolineales bacterium]
TDGKVILTGELSMPRVLNVMGCGDSALAGIASTLYRAGSLVEMLRRGVACGAANTQVLGAGFIDPNLVSQLESQVVLREVVM